MLRVAICQPKIILGGRLRVILALVEVLNEMGITPTILTGGLAFQPEKVLESYGKPLQVKYRLIPLISLFPQEYAIILFNFLLRLYASDYDLLINTSNSLIFLPKKKRVVTYMCFPRKRRIMSDVDIHWPEKPLKLFARLERMIFRLIYRLSKPQPEHVIVCLSEFTRSAVAQEYGTPHTLPIVYAPADTTPLEGNQKQMSIVSVGRFTQEKRQLEQLELAKKLPEIQFHIIGFVANESYYNECRLFVEQHRLKNVHLYPDASFEEIARLMQESKYFLHTGINEPFNMPTVQAIAAGCIPIVHDSGAEREIVPIPRLRYQNMYEVPQILHDIEGWGDEVISRLQRHVFRFDASVFHEKMTKILNPIVGKRVQS